MGKLWRTPEYAIHSVRKNSRNKYHYQIRKCRRAESFIRIQKIAESCSMTNNDLISEERHETERQRKVVCKNDSVIGGVSGKQIPEVFAEKYSKLFNRYESSLNSSTITMAKIEEMINEQSLKGLDKINSGSICEAVDKSKGN